MNSKSYFSTTKKFIEISMRFHPPRSVALNKNKSIPCFGVATSALMAYIEDSTESLLDSFFSVHTITTSSISPSLIIYVYNSYGHIVSNITLYISLLWLIYNKHVYIYIYIYISNFSWYQMAGGWLL